MSDLKESINSILNTVNNKTSNNPTDSQMSKIRKNKLYEWKQKAIPFINEQLSQLTDSQVQQVFNLIKKF